MFVVAGLGYFVPGYYLIITKSPYTSFAQLEDNEFKEYSWVIEKLSKKIKLVYGRSSVIFEHGMCACAGGLDTSWTRDACPSNGIEKIFEQSVNNILKKEQQE